MDGSRPLHGLAERVRDARSRMGLTQADFAERMAVTPLTVHRWETGQSRPRALALDRLRALEEAIASRGADARAGGPSGGPAPPSPSPSTSPGTRRRSCWWRRRTGWPTGTSSTPSDGARFLVATDAAGEGINLQFCRLMVNYDVPWNPARLEQRMGRIHRYGQKHDVRVVNLVAGGTHEGRVLSDHGAAPWSCCPVPNPGPVLTCRWPPRARNGAQQVP